MIYIIAVALGLAACVQGFLTEITAGNIGHLRNGRPPNARAALFPSIPFIPLLFVGVAWLLRLFISKHATWILLALFVTVRHLGFSGGGARQIVHSTLPAQINN